MNYTSQEEQDHFEGAAEQSVPPEPMTYTEERLEVFNKKFEWTDFSGNIGTHILAKKTSSYATEETERNELRTFLAESIQEARAEERERIEEMRNAPPPYPADEENPMKHVYQNEGYAKALDDILTP